MTRNVLPLNGSEWSFLRSKRTRRIDYHTGLADGFYLVHPEEHLLDPDEPTPFMFVQIFTQKRNNDLRAEGRWIMRVDDVDFYAWLLAEARECAEVHRLASDTGSVMAGATPPFTRLPWEGNCENVGCSINCSGVHISRVGQPG